MDQGKIRFENLMHFMSKDVGNKVKSNPEFLYKSRPGDVIIFGPPKTGTTWLQNILHQIRMKGDDDFRNQHDVTWYIADPNLATFNLNAEQVCNPRIYKCHQEYGNLRASKGVKSIFIIRDVYDTVYSSKKYGLRMMGGDEDMDDESQAKILRDNHDKSFLCYFCILNSWWPHRKDDDLYWLFYEDMQKDLTTVVRQLSEFINVPLTESEIQIVCKLCSFEHMAENKEKFESRDIVDRYNQAMGTNDEWTAVSVVRPDGGKVGQGRRNLGPKTSAFVERLWSEKITADYGFENYGQLYEDFSRFKVKY